jgi:hypothetical protein
VHQSYVTSQTKWEFCFFNFFQIDRAWTYKKKKTNFTRNGAAPERMDGGSFRQSISFETRKAKFGANIQHDFGAGKQIK